MLAVSVETCIMESGKETKMKTQKPIIPVRKMKGDGLIDFYDCRECGRRWKSTDKKIGHVRCPKGKW
jgi:hypothetical protein